jgi:hypothetical protein
VPGASPSQGFEVPGLPGVVLPMPNPAAGAATREPLDLDRLEPAPPGSHDANGFLRRPFLEEEAGRVHRALVEALPPRERAQMQSVPFRVVQEDDEPNAAAGCQRGSAIMMITSAMLELAAGIAETKAYDEVAGTDTHRQYVDTVVAQIRGRQRVTGPPPSMHAPPHALDRRKLARQRHLYAQQVAFIVGHELAHHYRGHTGCIAGRTTQEQEADELGRLLARAVPTFSQPREVEADLWGVTNVLEAGHGRAGGAWTEEGALLNLEFFQQLTERGGPDLAMVFLSTHPLPSLRIPLVRYVAQSWAPGRQPPPVPTVGGVLETLRQGRLPEGLPIDLDRLPIPLPQRPSTP